MKKFNTKDLVLISILVALNIVLSRFLSISAWNVKVGFTFVTLFVAAYLYGPLVAGLVGSLGDLIGALLFPIGAYFPGFTLTAFLMGFVFGIFLHKNYRTKNIIISCLINEIVLSLFLNTLWIKILYNSNYFALLSTRLIQAIVMSFVEICFIKLFSKSINQLERITK